MPGHKINNRINSQNSCQNLPPNDAKNPATTTNAPSCSERRLPAPEQKSFGQEALILLGHFLMLIARVAVYLSELCFNAAGAPMVETILQPVTDTAKTILQLTEMQFANAYSDACKKIRSTVTHARTNLNRKKLQGLITHSEDRQTVLDSCRKFHMSDGPVSAGSAYGYSWSPYRSGVKLDCGTMLAAHLIPIHEHDESLHGFPDMMSKVVPKPVEIGSTIEYWDGELKSAVVDGYVLSTGRFGARTIYGVLPSFKSDAELVSGTPIFFQGKLISVITTSNGNGRYTISGISRNSGHVKTHRVRVRKADAGQAVYGRLISNYESVKNEAMRQKTEGAGPINIEIVLFPDRMDVLGWNGDNWEIFHTRQPVGLTELTN